MEEGKVKKKNKRVFVLLGILGIVAYYALSPYYSYWQCQRSRPCQMCEKKAFAECIKKEFPEGTDFSQLQAYFDRSGFKGKIDNDSFRYDWRFITHTTPAENSHLLVKGTIDDNKKIKTIEIPF